MKSTKTKSLSREDISKDGNRKGSKKPWEPMKITYAGDAKDLVRGGGGKAGITQNDPGDNLKTPGQG